MSQFVITPCTLKQANAYIRARHRTHNPVVGCKVVFALAVRGKVVGVVIVARPLSRVLQQKYPLMAEVTRCCTDGTFDAASCLYAQAWVAARAIGYRRLITYTLPEEGGACLKALRQQGWKLVVNDDGEPCLFGGGSWDRTGRRRRQAGYPTEGKWRWEVSMPDPQQSAEWPDDLASET